MNFLDEWRLDFYFYKDESTFLFKHVILYYKLQGTLFPNSFHEGGQSEVYDFAFINSTLSKSYKCNAGIHIELGEVSLYMKHVIIEPFFNARRNPHIFEVENVCIGDLENPANFSLESWILSIVLGLFVAVIICSCLVFMCLKFKSRSKRGYKGVDGEEVERNTTSKENTTSHNNKRKSSYNRNKSEKINSTELDWGDEWIRRV